MRGGWIAVLFALAVVGAVSAWEARRRSLAEADRTEARDRACKLALEDAAARHRAHAAELDAFVESEAALRASLDAEREQAVAAVEALTVRGAAHDLEGTLRRRLRSRPGIDSIEVRRRADEERTAGWQEYAVRLRGGWNAVTAGIDAVHTLPVVVRVERLELRLDRTRRMATLDARVRAAVWSDPRIVEEAHPELAAAPSSTASLASACQPLDLCRAATPDAEALASWERACAEIDERAAAGFRWRRVDSERDEVKRLRALAAEIESVRVESRESVVERGAELLERAQASRRGYAGVDLAADEGAVWLD